MSSPVRPILSPSLSAKLAALANRPATNRELQDILAELAALPAHRIVQASREIARDAAIGWWQQEKRPGQLVPKHRARVFFQRIRDQLWPKSAHAPFPPDRELLAANADFAWLFLFHPSGYLREAALFHITTPPTSPFFLAALAWRLNDWVGPVRQAAKKCFKRVSASIAANVAADAAIYLLERRFIWGRWSDEVAILDPLFARDDVLSALALQLERRPTGGLSGCLRSALRYPGIDQHLPRLATTAVQPPIRAIAYQCLISRKASWPAGFDWVWLDKVYGLRRRIPKLDSRSSESNRPVADLIAEGIRDRSSFVRKIVADAMIVERSQIEDERALVSQLASDRHPAVRSRGEFLVRHPRSAQ
ncbi:hypothetical protein FBZ93_104463 [Bradyrhizobium macuxiense]|uniref:Uncharacterized protein n=1 Tax=Bradyrhizobium macuxiense TaxID=1755647 RepID=A0A560M0I1_9BRAD|nr:hypothetical protein [Bradyrhizobium macuxiense]TWC01186.1 hypothetical protein FBZ93_104463 [Bradyrhizobium macuxiense]